ncbi:Vitamin K epoxide reductase [Phytophthora cactorum]|nr:Vitamin K epoxide reductase [Phytophthora cactorum]
MAKHGTRLSVLGKQKTKLQGGYTALCDSEAFSCSQVGRELNVTVAYSSLLSHLGLVENNSTLDVSNAHLGVLAYSLFTLYPVIRTVPYHAQVYTAVSSCMTVVMVYLAYILVFVLRDFCMVCVATYVITAALLWSSVVLLRAERSVPRLRKSNKLE